MNTIIERGSCLQLRPYLSDVSLLYLPQVHCDPSNYSFQRQWIDDNCIVLPMVKPVPDRPSATADRRLLHYTRFPHELNQPVGADSQCIGIRSI